VIGVQLAALGNDRLKRTFRPSTIDTATAWLK
jgi:hypothetical protein